MWSSPGRPVQQVLLGLGTGAGQACEHFIPLSSSPFRNSTATDPTRPHLSFGLFCAQSNFFPSPQSPSPPHPVSFTIPGIEQGPLHALPWLVQLALKPSWGPVQSLSCSLSDIAQLHALCQPQRTVLFSPHQGLGPFNPHTHTPGDRPGLALRPVSQGLGLDLTKGCNEPRLGLPSREPPGL